MTGTSKIEWTEQTWNPIVGCSIVSPGCTNCYAMKMAARIEAMGNQPRYAGTTRKVNGNAVWTGKLAHAPESVLLAPLKRKKPTTYFVNSMGDLFHEDVPDEWIDRVLAVMALCPQHTFQVLTKRAARMRDYCSDMLTPTRLVAAAMSMPGGEVFSATWPLPNVWLGVSAERQQEYDERWPDLANTPGAVRFVSYEPALGPLNIQSMALVLDRPAKMFPDWVICGGESGHHARPMHPGWARDLRDQCALVGISFFFKQWGEFHPRTIDGGGIAETCIAINGAISRGDELIGGPEKRPRWCGMDRVGKARAGRLLDGIEHNGMPERAA